MVTLYLQTQFGQDRCTQFRVIVVTHPQTQPQTNTQTGAITIHCAAASAQCNNKNIRLNHIYIYIYIYIHPTRRRLRRSTAKFGVQTLPWIDSSAIVSSSCRWPHGSNAGVRGGGGWKKEAVVHSDWTDCRPPDWVYSANNLIACVAWPLVASSLHAACHLWLDTVSQWSSVPWRHQILLPSSFSLSCPSHVAVAAYLPVYLSVCLSALVMGNM